MQPIEYEWCLLEMIEEFDFFFLLYKQALVIGHYLYLHNTKETSYSTVSSGLPWDNQHWWNAFLSTTAALSQDEAFYILHDPKAIKQRGTQTKDFQQWALLANMARCNVFIAD